MRLHHWLMGLCVVAAACVAEVDELPDDEFRDLPASIPECGDACLPLIQDCYAGEKCAWTGDWECIESPIDKTQGEDCTRGNECAPAYACVQSDRVPGCSSGSCCAALCALSETLPGCDCVDVFEGDDDDVGVCLTPGFGPASVDPALCYVTSEPITKKN